MEVGTVEVCFPFCQMRLLRACVGDFFFFFALLFGDRITRFHGDGERWVEQRHNNVLTDVGFFPHFSVLTHADEMQ